VSESNSGTLIETSLESALSGALILPIKSINIASDDLVTESTNDGENVVVVCEVWWTHVSWNLSNDGQESGLELSHFTDDTVVAEGGQIRVVPSMRANLMAVSHALNLSFIVVDAVVVLTVDEESSPHASSFNLIQNIGGIDIWTIIESNSECSWNSTASNNLSYWYSLLER